MKGLIIWMKDGVGQDESLLDELGTEIRDRGGRVEVFHSRAAEKLGMEEDPEARSEACAMLARHGVVVIASGNGPCGITPDGEIAIREISRAELADHTSHNGFMRDLELAGLVPPPRHDVHPDDEKEILEKLRKLGYLDD